jgi:HPt (histidine-containing phosphotransfer) domain-containing protein
MMTTTTSDASANPGAEATLPVLDRTSLLERTGDASAAAMLLEMLQQRLTQIVGEISSELAIIPCEAGTVRKVHTLKGNAGNLSADRLYHAASLLEAALRCDDFANVPARLRELQQEAEALQSAIPEMLQQLS